MKNLKTVNIIVPATALILLYLCRGAYLFFAEKDDLKTTVYRVLSELRILLEVSLIAGGILLIFIITLKLIRK